MKIRSQFRSFFCILLMSVAGCSVSAARDVAVVVDKTNKASALSLADLAKIMKTTTKSWSDGKKITVFVNDPESADMKMVLQKVYGIDAAEMRAFADAHRGSIIMAGSDDVIVKAVQTNPGAIGLVNVYSINSGVKVLRVDGKLPLESGYLLHGN